MNPWLEYLARWHVALIHFPIGLLITAAVVEAVTTARRFEVPSVSAMIMVCCGALGAIVSSILGWMLAADASHPDAEHIVELHRWGGVVASVLAVLAAGFGWAGLRGRENFRWPFRALLLAAAVAVIITGHWGGELIYGEGYFSLPGSDEAAEVEDISEE